MTQAEQFAQAHRGDTAALMAALDAAGVPADQDWANERTIWTFADGSSIEVNGPVVRVMQAA